MKEVHYFYTPDAEISDELTEEEAAHAVRVLRMKPGDSIMLMDGNGCFFEAEITESTNKRCFYRIKEKINQPKEWNGHLHIAMAPTKNMDRTEWFVEKATEIGIDEISFLISKNSERKVIKLDRVNRIVVSAVKQSRKSFLPQLNEMVDFIDFISQDIKGLKCICHCYDDTDFPETQPKVHLKDIVRNGEDITVLVGPEGDFSIDEVRKAIKKGFVPVTLGKSRLRTETACLVAVNIMNLFNQ